MQDALHATGFNSAVKCAEIWAKWLTEKADSNMEPFIQALAQELLRCLAGAPHLILMAVARKSCPACPPRFEPPALVLEILRKLALPGCVWETPRGTSLVREGEWVVLFRAEAPHIDNWQLVHRTLIGEVNFIPVGQGWEELDHQYERAVASVLRAFMLSPEQLNR